MDEYKDKLVKGFLSGFGYSLAVYTTGKIFEYLEDEEGTDE